MSNMVSWRDYEGIDGFGSATQQDVDDLNKALRAGQAINPPGSVTAGDGFSLRVESLESTLRSVQYRMEHIRLWKMCTKIPAYNTVEEYNLLESFGENLDAGFIDEGDLPTEDDSKYERKFAVVKYLGTLRRVTHVMSLVRPAHGNVINRETVNGTMHLLRMTERSLFTGDSTLSALQFDGFDKLMRDGGTKVIDLRGKPMSEDIMVDAALIVGDKPGYGIPTDMFANPSVIADLAKVFFPKERHDPFRDRDGMIRTQIKGWDSPYGPVRFQPDVFIDDGGAPNAAAIGDVSKIPATPTETTTGLASGSGSKFAADDVGTYQYAVVAVNRYGRSAKLQLTATAVGNAGEQVDIGVTPPGSTPLPDWYELYRSVKGGAAGSERLIKRIPNAAGAAEQTLTDTNAKLPGTTSAYLFQGNVENMSVKQLAPLVKIPLATIDTSIRWMQLLYIVPVLYTPLKNVLFENVGRVVGAESYE